jgi:2-methylcitrate dehydratase PrpD
MPDANQNAAETPGSTRAMAEAILAVAPEGIPEPVLHRGRQCLLDFLGVAMGAADEPAIEILVSTARSLRTNPVATVLGRVERADAPWAALINGSMAHALDFDDTHFPTLLHGYAAILAAELALCESFNAPVPGSRFLAAFVAGYETSARAALSLHPAHYDRGWHVSGTAGVFGAAAACGCLLGLSGEQMARALGLAASQGAGLREVFGSMNKCLQVGKAAQSGLLAALLAAGGFTSSPQALEAPRGFCRVFSDSPHPEALTSGWGSRWEILFSGFKPYPCGVVTHPAIEAILALHDEQGVRSEAVARIRVRCNPRVVELTGVVAPASGLEAKFSIYHCLAAALTDGMVGTMTFTDARVHDSALAALRQLIQVETDTNLAPDQAEVTVKLSAGLELGVFIEHAVGSPDHPLTDGQLAAKFTALAAGRLGDSAAQEIREEVDRLETLADVTTLLKLCRGGTQG